MKDRPRGGLVEHSATRTRASRQALEQLELGQREVGAGDELELPAVGTPVIERDPGQRAALGERDCDGGPFAAVEILAESLSERT